MATRYLDSAMSVAEEHLGGFFVGWPNPPSPATHLQLLRGSQHVVVAVEPDSNLVIGFITALSDGVLSAYIPLLEVLPEHQGKGIGSELLRRLLAQLAELYMIDVSCDTELFSFYQRAGFAKSHGMSIRNYARQSGKRH